MSVKTTPAMKETAANYLLPVFFTPKMVASAPSSPSAAKPPQVVADWKAKALPIRVYDPDPVTAAQLSLAHDARMVAAVLACEAANGFGTRSRQVARSLPYTTGAMLSAARHVLRHGGAACAPCSGFHHAGFDSGHGYCTFNGLMVTAAVLRQEGLVGRWDHRLRHAPRRRNRDIIDRLGASSWVRHFTAGPEFDRPGQVEAFFKRLARVMESMQDCDLVLYQAGADPHDRRPLRMDDARMRCASGTSPCSKSHGARKADRLEPRRRLPEGGRREHPQGARASRDNGERVHSGVW